MDIDELRPSESPTLVFEEYWHPVQCHDEEERKEWSGAEGERCGIRIHAFHITYIPPHDAPDAIPGEFDEELTLGPKQQE